MVEYKYADLYLQNSKDKQLKINFDAGTITNTELHSENFELSESICSGEVLRFGSCEASGIKFRISNITTSLKDKWLTVTETLDGNTDVSFSFGKYKVSSDKPTADRRYRDITAYDAMYDILHAEVSGWYNTILPAADSTVTLKAFRDSFLDYFGIEQENVTLVNDSMIVTKTIEPTGLSGKTVITAICEINGCFGHIGRDGKFKYVFLKDTGLYQANILYPAENLYPAEDLYPVDDQYQASNDISIIQYIKAEYEDYTTALINKLQIRQEEDDIGCIYGTGDNCYIVQDNFLVYGKSSEELNVIAKNLYSIISIVTYQPVHVEAKGNPCLEVGGIIELRTRNGVITSYILQRTLKGIQALRDTYDAEGEQYQTEKINSIKDQIIQLKGKTNKLTRTVEETRLEIADIERGLSSRITQNAYSIKTEVTRATEAEGRLNTLITQTADNIRLEVSKTYSSKEEMRTELSLQQDQIQLRVEKNGVVSAINASSEKITISAAKIDLVGLVSAKEFTSKYAEITSLKAATAEINTLKTDKLSASQFTAANINAMGIVAGSVAAENITGTTISGKTLIGGEIRSNNYVASSSAYTCGGGMRIDLASGNIWWGNGSIKASTGFMYSIGYDVPSTGGGYNLYFKSALALKSADSTTLIVGAGFSDVELKSGASITSLAEKKENILPCANALSAIQNTDVYYFNYKDDDVKRSDVQKVGFVIGEGYNLDPRLLSKNGDAIDIYNAIGLNWRATQQLYEKVKTLQKQMGEILQTLANQEVS